MEEKNSGKHLKAAFHSITLEGQSISAVAPWPNGYQGPGKVAGALSLSHSLSLAVQE